MQRAKNSFSRFSWPRDAAKFAAKFRAAPRQAGSTVAARSESSIPPFKLARELGDVRGEEQRLALAGVLVGQRLYAARGVLEATIRPVHRLDRFDELSVLFIERGAQREGASERGSAIRAEEHDVRHVRSGQRRIRLPRVLQVVVPLGDRPIPQLLHASQVIVPRLRARTPAATFASCASARTPTGRPSRSAPPSQPVRSARAAPPPRPPSNTPVPTIAGHSRRARLGVATTAAGISASVVACASGEFTAGFVPAEAAASSAVIGAG